ncbi:MAG: recombinase family protein [Lyngbya sp.]|nr:recombinase family protein [Lyngbya sp.]
MKIGYARISTGEQNLNLQLDSLRDCDLVFQEIESGAVCERPILKKAIAKISPGDVLVVWRLDRLGRSLKHLVELVELLKLKGIAFKSLSENIDTTNATGELVFHFFAALAQFERSLIKERCQAGLQAAKSRGVHCGRPQTPAGKLQAIAKLVQTGESVASACRQVGVDKSTYYRNKKRQGSATLVA